MNRNIFEGRQKTLGLPWSVRLSNFWASRKRLFWFLVILLSLLLFVLVTWVGSRIPLVAAVAGGAISFVIQRNQYQADAAIDKKEKIYIPLYDDLIKLRGKIKVDPY